MFPTYHIVREVSVIRCIFTICSYVQTWNFRLLENRGSDASEPGFRSNCIYLRATCPLCREPGTQGLCRGRPAACTRCTTGEAARSDQRLLAEVQSAERVVTCPAVLSRFLAGASNAPNTVFFARDAGSSPNPPPHHHDPCVVRITVPWLLLIIHPICILVNNIVCASVLNQDNVVGREYTYVNATVRNRRAFVRAVDEVRC